VTSRFGARLYPAAERPWRRLLFPWPAQPHGYLPLRFFSRCPGERRPQTKAALYARGGEFTGHVFGNSSALPRRWPRDSLAGRSGGTSRAGIVRAWQKSRALPEKVRRSCPWGRQPQSSGIHTTAAAVLFSLEEWSGFTRAVLARCAGSQPPAMLRLLLEMIRCFSAQYQLVIEGDSESMRYSVAGGFVSAAFTKLLLWMRARFCVYRKRLVVPTRGGRD